MTMVLSAQKTRTRAGLPGWTTALPKPSRRDKAVGTVMWGCWFTREWRGRLEKPKWLKLEREGKGANALYPQRLRREVLPGGLGFRYIPRGHVCEHPSGEDPKHLVTDQRGQCQDFVAKQRERLPLLGIFPWCVRVESEMPPGVRCSRRSAGGDGDDSKVVPLGKPDRRRKRW